MHLVLETKKEMCVDGGRLRESGGHADEEDGENRENGLGKWEGEGSLKRKRVEDAGDEYVETSAEAERRRNKEFQKFVGEQCLELGDWMEDQDKRNQQNVGWFEKVTLKLVMLEEKMDRVIAMLREMKKNEGGAENAEDAEGAEDAEDAEGAENAEGAEDAEGEEDETMKV